ncbi:hypothetical protein ACFL96_04810 [Thermoproteota archaeon]
MNHNIDTIINQFKNIILKSPKPIPSIICHLLIGFVSKIARWSSDITYCRIFKLTNTLVNIKNKLIPINPISSEASLGDLPLKDSGLFKKNGTLASKTNKTDNIKKPYISFSLDAA